MAASKWKVVLEPLAENPDDTGRNMSGLVVYVEGEDGVRKEHSRVAYMRKNSQNPDVPFKKQLRQQLEAAVEVAEMLRTSEEAVEVARQNHEDAKAARDKATGGVVAGVGAS